MKYIANILTNKSFSDKELYNVVKTKDELIEGIPTLIVGREYIKTFCPNVDLMNWEIKWHSLYWTYGNREKRNRYEKNIVEFRKIAMEEFIKSVKYEFINIMICSKEEKKQFLNTINELAEIPIYLKNDMVYIYDGNNKKVYGISLRGIKYIGKDPKNFLSMLHKCKRAKFIELGDELSWETKNSLRNNQYIIPYLYS